MAIEREIPKDISKYEPKFAGPFTIRNLVFGIPGIALAVVCHFLLRPFVPNDVNFFINIVVALPFLLCGWVKPYGIPFEKYISIVFISLVLAPKHRKYHTENLYNDLKEQPQVESPPKKKTNKKKKKDYPSEMDRFE